MLGSAQRDSCSKSRERRSFKTHVDVRSFVVHGDHGSRISVAHYRELGRDDVSDRDIIDNVSTLCAVRIPGEDPTRSDRLASIQRLFSERFLDRSRKPGSDSIYLRGTDLRGGMPYTLKAMPALPGSE